MSIPMTRTIKEGLHVFRRFVVPLVIYDVWFAVAQLAVAAPISAWVLTALLSRSGSLAVGNEQIVAFLLSPSGLLALVLSVAFILCSLFVEQAGVMLIAAHATLGRRPSVRTAILTVLRRLRLLAVLGLRQALAYLLVGLPFIAAAALTYVALLSRHDINYLVAEYPPVFLLAIGIGMVLLAGLAATWTVLFARWIFAVPLCLVQTMPAAKAMRESRRLTQGSLGRLVVFLAAWVLATVVLLAVLGPTAELTGDLVLMHLPSNLTLVIAAAAVLLVLHGLAAAAAWFFCFAMYSIVVMGLFFEHASAQDGIGSADPMRAQLEASADLSPSLKTARRVIWPAVIIVGVWSVYLCHEIIETIRVEDRVAVTAHRGSSNAAPENTLSAIRQAISDGADFAEIDVQEAADGEVVVVHDEDLMRLAGVDKKVWETPYAELRELDVGSWFSPEFQGERIPTLAQVIETAKGKIKLNIELKLTGHEERLVESVLRTIREASFESECVITSLSVDALAQARTLNKDIPIGYIVYGSFGDIAKLEVDFLSVATRLATDRLIKQAHQEGRAVHVWTVNDPKQMSLFIERGVDNIITDVPEVLVGLLRERAELSDEEKVLLAFAYWLR